MRFNQYFHIDCQERKTMGRDQKSNKEQKKKALLTPKEKRAAKKARKDATKGGRGPSNQARDFLESMDGPRLRSR